jgi:hypothetical protein
MDPHIPMTHPGMFLQQSAPVQLAQPLVNHPQIYSQQTVPQVPQTPEVSVF